MPLIKFLPPLLSIVVSLMNSRIIYAQNVGSTNYYQEEPSPILELSFLYDKNSPELLKITNSRVVKGYVPKRQESEPEYVLTFIKEGGITSRVEYFHVPKEIHLPPPINSDGNDVSSTELDKLEFSLAFNYNPQWLKVRLSDFNSQFIQEVDLKNIPVIETSSSFTSIEASQIASEDNSDPNEFRSAFSPNHKVDVVFIGDNYLPNEMAKFREDVQAFSQHLIEYPPFSGHIGDMVFHIIDNTIDLGCYFHPPSDRFLVCNNSAVYSAINNSAVPYDTIVVIVNEQRYGGSGGSIGVTYNGSLGKEVFVHEFGHSFVGLLDEYNTTSSNGPINNTATRNCFSGAPPYLGWEDRVQLSDYTQGCYYPNWYRSSPCSIMIYLSCKYFNKISQDIISQQINFYLTVEPTPSPSPTPIPKKGDANHDNRVDGIDYVIWLNFYNQTTDVGAWDGDFNEDGNVDGKDYVIWLNNYER